MTNLLFRLRNVWIFSISLLFCLSCGSGYDSKDSKGTSLTLEKLGLDEKPRNVIFILSDDHRYDFPHTPTMHGVRTDRYKYIRYHGIWDTNEFYDLLEDPYEMNNLIASSEHRDQIEVLAHEIYDWLESTDGMQIPLKRTVKNRSGDHRNPGVF